jgi:biotin carboxylase
MGIPLHRIREIRLLWNEQPFGETPLDLDNLRLRKPPHGHVIATRITAENPDEGFKPNNGQLGELTFRSSTNVWGYFSVSGTGMLVGNKLDLRLKMGIHRCFFWINDRFIL